MSSVPLPTQVVSDHLEGRSVVAALKGDFYVGKLESTKKLGVAEDYTKKEYDHPTQPIILAYCSNLRRKNFGITNF